MGMEKEKNSTNPYNVKLPELGTRGCFLDAVGLVTLALAVSTLGPPTWEAYQRYRGWKPEPIPTAPVQGNSGERNSSPTQVLPTALRTPPTATPQPGNEVDPYGICKFAATPGNVYEYKAPFDAVFPGQYPIGTAQISNKYQACIFTTAALITDKEGNVATVLTQDMEPECMSSKPPGTTMCLTQVVNGKRIAWFTGIQNIPDTKGIAQGLITPKSRKTQAPGR